MSRIEVVNDARFAEEVERWPGVVAVKFSAEWCAPCRVLAPVVEALAAEYAPRLRVFGVDADESAQTAARYDVRGIPTILLFRDGAVVDRIVGVASKDALRARFDAALAA